MQSALKPKPTTDPIMPLSAEECRVNAEKCEQMAKSIDRIDRQLAQTMAKSPRMA